MQNLNMKNLWKILLISGLIIAYPCYNANARKITATTQQEETRVKELDDMTNDELLASVDLGKNAELVKKFQFNEAVRLINEKYNSKINGCNVETMRNGEVIIITIPSSLLFMPNDTTLRSDASEWLSPLKRYMKTDRPDMYRVLLNMHTDNTGSDEYTDQLSLQRVESVFGWFADNGSDTRYIFPSASGCTDPLPGVSNNTMENRARNRRLEVYLIPGRLMLEAAKKGRIAM